MAGIVIIGDEVTCTGFRLAGVQTHTPAPEDIRRVFGEARAEADVIALTAGYARLMPRAELEEALLAETPAIAIIPDLRESETPPNLARKIRATLGIEG